MIEFLKELKSRNELLFYFSALLSAAAIIFLVLTRISNIQVAGINAWFKPFKFAISIAVYCSTMAWFIHYLPEFNVKAFSWINILLFSFELVYITIQAGRAQESHFNQSTPFYHAMFVGMALAAVAISVYAAWVGFKFIQYDFPELSNYYVWAIRLSIFIFIIFSLEGILMGGRQSHSIGIMTQNTFLPIFKWNMTEGDLRVAHFIGMHALQVIPFLTYYVLKNTKAVFILSGIYFLFALFVLIQALQAKPFIKAKQQHETLKSRV